MAKSLIKTWKKFVPESAEKKEKKKEEREKSKDDKNGGGAGGGEDSQSGGGAASSGPIGDKGSSFPPRPQATSDQVRCVLFLLSTAKYLVQCSFTCFVTFD